MKIPFKTLHAGLLAGTLGALALVSLAAEPAQPQASPAPAPGASAAPSPEPGPKGRHHHDGDDDRVAVMGAAYVGPGEVIEGSAVAVMGPVTVDGTVNGDAVAVMGTNTVNGSVHGDAVAVLGDVRLGPNAQVDGDAVAAGGHVIRGASSSVGGRVVEKSVGSGISDNPSVSEWLKHAGGMGRPVALGAHLHWLWMASVGLAAFYVLLALVFPNGIRKCGETLSQRPGTTFLVGFLGVLGLPVLFVLLLVTVVGIPVAIVVLPLAAIACVIFGKAAVCALVGRSVAGRQLHAALAVAIGAAIFLALYFVPFLGGALFLLVAFVGFACALTTLILSGRPALPPAASPAAPLAAPGAAAAPPPLQAPLAAPAPPLVSPAPAPQAAPAVPQISETELPRAGFWIRMVALLIDAVLVGIVTQSTRMHAAPGTGSFFLPAIALYGALLWKFRGATIGGIIFGLKVVRTDGKEMDWVTAAVRALACFFSLIVVGLGFIWIGFDREKQGWHDKIAGTVVVRLPKGVSLV